MDKKDYEYVESNSRTQKKSRKVTSKEDQELKREMHRKCESRRRERINQTYDNLFGLLKNTSMMKTRKGPKIDRNSLIRFTCSYMKELRQSVNVTARLLCKLASTNPDLVNLFPPSQLMFILQTDFVDDDVCMLLATCYNMPYNSKLLYRGV